MGAAAVVSGTRAATTAGDTFPRLSLPLWGSGRVASRLVPPIAETATRTSSILEWRMQPPEGMRQLTPIRAGPSGPPHAPCLVDFHDGAARTARAPADLGRP